MTDCNANQLVVKAQIEHDRAAAQNQQVATADQLTARQTAPAAPNVDHATPPQVGTQTSGQDQSGVALNIPHEVIIDNDSPASASLDPQTLGAGATLSDLDRAGLSVWVTRTTRASGTIRGGEQPSTSGAVDSQPISTGQAGQDLGNDDLGDVDILDIEVDESEDFAEIDPAWADHLLADGPEEMIKNWVTGCNKQTTAEHAVDEITGCADPSADCSQASSDPLTPEEEGAPEEMDASEAEPSVPEAQPGLTRYKHVIKIDKVGEFFRKDGQPRLLHAYPPVSRPAGLQTDDPDQAYRGQDLIDPSVIQPRHTRRERLRRQEEEQQRQQKDKTLPTPVASAGMTERVWYSGERIIETRSQPWPKRLDGKFDLNTLIMCDQYVTEAARQEPTFGRPGQTLALFPPGYLTIVTPGDDTVLPAKQAIETSAALPYARGKQQEPIGERVIVNDLYGIPLYKPAVSSLHPTRGTGAAAAKKIIDSTGTDPNFVSDEVVRGSSTGTYPLMYQDDDSGPM